MNLREFTEVVDRQSEKLERGDLLCLIRSIARKIPENQRQEFLEILDEVQKRQPYGEEQRAGFYAVHGADRQEIRTESDRLLLLFGQIRNGELYLKAQGYEDYSRSYWDSDWLWEYQDHGIGRIYEESARLMQRCVNTGCYHEAVQIFQQMMDTEVLVVNDWDDFHIGLEKLVKEKLASIDLDSLALYVLYAQYQVLQEDARAVTIYSYYQIPFFRKIRLEDMLSIGREELKGLSRFWDDWITLLSKEEGDVPARLLMEAVRYQKGNSGLLEAARLAYAKHPSLYLEALKSLDVLHNYQKQIEIGTEALANIDHKYVYRSLIAIQTAEAAIRAKDEIQAEKCLAEAFRSHTTPLNYLRFINECSSPAAYHKILEKAIEEVQHGVYTAVHEKELEQNMVSENTYTALKFLHGDFAYAMDACRKVKGALGWTGTFIKSGIALFLLLLNKDDDWKQGCQELADQLVEDIGFTADEYLRGTKAGDCYGTTPARNREVFYQCFIQWKKHYSLDECQQQEYMSCIETMIDKRVNAIVSGQYRNHYRIAAALVAAYGEVAESMGEAAGKQKRMMKYRSKYPRHSSFYGSLKGFGMRDMGKRGKNII